MKPTFATFSLLLAASYREQSRHCVRIALDAKREAEPNGFWLARARFLAAEMRGYLAQWRRWTVLPA